MICKKCAKEIQDDFKVCPYCGQPVETIEDYIVSENSIQSAPVEETAPVVEPKLTEESQIVPPVLDNAVQNQAPEFNTNQMPNQQPPFVNDYQNPNAQPFNYGEPYINGNVGQPVYAPKKKNITAPIVIGAVVFIVIAFCLFSSFFTGNSFNFSDKYASISSESWCEIADDGTWMKLDTNPNNYDNDYYILYYEDSENANSEIKQVNEDLGFSSAVYESMCSTTALQGRQSEENDNFKVSWTYHPDKGLEVLYEVK